jgi:hypothetical protein
MKKFLICLFAISLLGCANRVAPVKLKWPDVPQDLIAPPEELTPLDPNQTRLSDIIDNANINYSKYYILKDRYEAWQQWYNSQKQIYQGAQ